MLGANASGPLLARKIMRANYYWLTMESDYIRHVRTCHRCQVYQIRKNVPSVIAKAKSIPHLGNGRHRTHDSKSLQWA